LTPYITSVVWDPKWKGGQKRGQVSAKWRLRRRRRRAKIGES